MAVNPMARFGKKPKDNTGKGNPLAGYGEKPKANTGAGNPVARFGTPGKPSGGGGGGAKKPSKPSAPPVSSAAQAKAAKAQSSAKRYAQVQRAANKAKSAVVARKGPQDLAGREQRKMDLKRYRELQAGADSWKNKARGQGLRFGGDKPAGTNQRPASPGTGGGSSSSGGGTSAGGAVARATGSQARSTANPTRPQAPKAGAVLAKARKMDNSGKGTPITAKELSSFIAFYNKTHEGTLSRSDAVLMARLLKKNNPKAAKKYGLNVATEN